MMSAKQKTSQQSVAPLTRKATLASKLSVMAAENEDCEENIVSMSQLVSELDKQRSVLKEDISMLIQESLKPIQTSVDAVRDTVNSFQARLASTEAIASENFERLNSAEATIKTLQVANQELLDRVDDLENRSRRTNLRIVNIPEGSEDGKDPVKFMEELLMDCVGSSVFTEPPKLERAHRTLANKPAKGKPARAFVVCFRRFQQKEAALRWARNNEVKFDNATLRFYPDLSAILAKKRKAFNGVKQALYEKGVKFSLTYPARLRVTLGKETFTFESPDEAMEFYKKRIRGSKEGEEVLD